MLSFQDVIAKNAVQKTMLPFRGKVFCDTGKYNGKNGNQSNSNITRLLSDSRYVLAEPLPNEKASYGDNAF